MENFIELCELKPQCRLRKAIKMEFTAEIIAQHLGGHIEGDPNVKVSTFAKIEDAAPGSITFLANPKYTHFIYNTDASIVLVRNDFEPEYPVKATLVKVDDPYGCLAKLLNLAGSVIKPRPVGIEDGCHIDATATVGDSCYIGAFAYLAPGVVVGDNVKIYPGCYVGHGVVIGDDTVLYPGVKVYYGCRIGKRCVIHAGAVIGSDGFGFAPDSNGVYHKIEQIGIVEIEDDVEIGANTTVDRSTMGHTHIHRGVKLDNLIQIAHNVEVGHDTVMAAQAGVAGSTKIGANCMIGGQVGFAGHISVGDRVQIGAQSGIPKDVPSDSKVMGYPAVSSGDFARMAAAMKHLPEMVRKLAALEKTVKELK